MKPLLFYLGKLLNISINSIQSQKEKFELFEKIINKLKEIGLKWNLNLVMIIKIKYF